MTPDTTTNTGWGGGDAAAAATADIKRQRFAIEIEIPIQGVAGSVDIGKCLGRAHNVKRDVRTIRIVADDARGQRDRIPGQMVTGKGKPDRVKVRPCGEVIDVGLLQRRKGRGKD